MIYDNSVCTSLWNILEDRTLYNLNSIFLTQAKLNQFGIFSLMKPFYEWAVSDLGP
jgi:hypothetical protein